VAGVGLADDRMKFFFDESGSFAIPDSWLTHRAAVVMGVAIPEVIEEPLHREFDDFAATLHRTEKEGGEPKGGLLSPQHRSDFSDRLAAHDGVLVIPVTLDLSCLTRHRDFPNHMGNLLADWAALMHSDEAKDALRLAGRQFANLSLEQALRLYSLANCMREALQHAILFRTSRPYEACWDSVSFTVDRVQERPNSREEQVFSAIVFGWISGWTRRHPFDLLEGLHTKDNPFIRKYDTEEGISLTRLMKGNIHWVDSKASWGVQVADIAATIVREAVRDLSDDNGAIRRFVSLMRSSTYGAAKGPGLFAPVPEATELLQAKYWKLAEARRDRR